MSIALLFWLIMVIWLVFGFWSNWPLNAANGRPFGNTLLGFVLFAILGWAVFGSAIHR
jgi:O-antigen ligase